MITVENHPLLTWLKRRQITREAFSLSLGKSPACASRWIAGIRTPDDDTRAEIERITTDPATGASAVPASVWHKQAIGADLREATTFEAAE